MKKLHLSLFIALILSSIAPSLYAEDSTAHIEQKADEKSTAHNTRIPEKIDFIYKDKPLIDIVNELAGLKQVNIILPQGALAKGLQTKITFELHERITVDQAWNVLLQILDLAKYTVRPQGNMISIVSSEVAKNITSEPLQLFINTHPADLPYTDQIIRYIFYFNNLSVRTNKQSIQTILQDMLSVRAPGQEKASMKSIVFDEKTNAVIVVDRANNIKEAMHIVRALDMSGFPDAIEVVPLHYTAAPWVDDIFKKIMKQDVKEQRGRGGKKQKMPYFPPDTRILSLQRSNSIVIMGTTRSIKIVRDFIIKYLDTPPEQGESVLHKYDLQYLNAEKAKEALEAIIKKSPSEGDQTTTKATGPKKYFEGVVIIAEVESKTKETIQQTGDVNEYQGTDLSLDESTENQASTLGGNSLIVAAHKQDWVRIKKLIQEIDKPELQVALEVLIIDVSLNRLKQLGSQMRNKESFENNVSGNINWQTSHISNPVLKLGPADQAFNNRPTDAIGGGDKYPPDALMSNLLQLDANGNNLANSATPGTFVFSITDPLGMSGVWSVWHILNQYTDTTILSQPYIITQNHKQASISTAETRYLPGQSSGSNAGAIEIQNEEVTAALSVDLLPHISRDNTINLQIVINISEFLEDPNVVTADTNNNRATRVLKTNAHVGNGEILALGGLTRYLGNDAVRKTPVLADIPILGWFFKRKSKDIRKNNLIVLISPTIIAPYTKGRLEDYSCNKILNAKNLVNEGLTLSNLRDPITRWFFKPDTGLTAETIDAYVDQGYNADKVSKRKRTWDTILESTRADKQARSNKVKGEINNSPAHIKRRQELAKNEIENNNNNTQPETLRELLHEAKNPLMDEATHGIIVDSAKSNVVA